MKKKYFLNIDTHRLHIEGYCRFSNSVPDHVKWFDTEDEALAYDGRALGLCKLCLKKREQLESR